MRRPSNFSTKAVSSPASTRRRRAASANRAGLPRMRVPTWSARWSAQPSTSDTMVSSVGWSSSCSGVRTAPSNTAGSPSTDCSDCIASIGFSRSSELNFSVSAEGFGRNAAACRRMSESSRSVTCGRLMTACMESSLMSVHIRTSSRGSDHSSAKPSMLEMMNIGIADDFRGIGRSY